MTYPIIGMSPGNSYFKNDTVRFLLEETVQRFGRTAVFVADIPAIANYRALGYPENRARSKAILKGNNLKNRSRRIAEELGIADKVAVIDWENEVQNNEKYRSCYDAITGLYRSNLAFAASVDRTTREFLDGNDIPDIEAAVETASHYLLSELAFLEYAPTFFVVEEVAYVYHKNWPVYEEYIAGVYDGKKKDHLKFLLLPSLDNKSIVL